MKITRPGEHEYGAIQRYLEDTYGHSRNFFLTRYPHVWRPENTCMEDILVIREQGAIVSLVRIFPLKLHLGDAVVTAGGIGGVCTAFSHRGKGYMTCLMQAAVAEMEKRGYQISILWGDRHRYSSFGYETGGRVMELYVNSRGLNKAGEKEIEARRFSGETEILGKMYQCYQRHLFRKERTRREFALLHHKPLQETYCARRGRLFAYLTLEGEIRGGQVIEFGGDTALLPGMLKCLAARFGISGFLFSFPDSSQVPPEILLCAGHWKINPVGMIKVLDLKATFCAYLKVLEASFPDRGEITFQVENKPPVLLKKAGGKLVIAEEAGKNILTLAEPELVRLIFGTFFWTPSGISWRTREILRSIFPLPIFLWPLDHV